MNYRPITDTWILARPKVRYYGAFPNGFLERARALLGVTPYDPILHVCGGRVKDYPAKPRGYGPFDKTLDLDPALSPDYLQDALDALPLNQGQAWAAVLIDPPYTVADAAHYNTRAQIPKAGEMLKAGLQVVRAGGRVGMLHYVLPQPPRVGVRFVACVGVVVGFNNKMRCFSVFERDGLPTR
jgi:hypothetical protein